MTARPKAAKVSNVTTWSPTRTINFLTTPDPIGFYLENADKRNLRLVSKGFDRAFFDNLKCADAQELQEELADMRKESKPCKNTARVVYSKGMGMQRAIMCAIMSVDQTLHVYVKTGDLEPFLASESVNCFDRNYELELTLLYPRAQQTPPSKPEQLYCHGGFHALATCVDAKELEEMRLSKCKNSTRVWYNPEENMRYAIMCAIISVDQTLHLYVNQEHLTQFLSSERVKWFDSNYALELTLLYPVAQQDPPMRPEELRCAGGFRALKGGWARNGRFSREGVQVVRFTGNTHIAEKVLQESRSLIEVLDVNTIEYIGWAAFRYCKQLTQLGDMPEIRIIRSHAFQLTRLTQLGDMPELTEIGQFAFANTYLTQLGDMPELTAIYQGAFMNTKLTQLGDLPELTFIDKFAFENTALTQLGDMPELIEIGDFAFAGTPLTQLRNMDSLTTIRDFAFQGCEHLNSVRLPKTLTHVGSKAFEGCPLGDLTVESGANFECECANLANRLRQLDFIVET